MNTSGFQPKLPVLIAGDIIVLGIVTIYGFASHEQLGTAGLRMLTTFVPLLVAWFLIAPHLKVYDRSYNHDLRQIWRPFWAMILAAPMFGFLRGLWLQSPIVPVFVIVIGGVGAIGLLLWRGVYSFLLFRYRQRYG